MNRIHSTAIVEDGVILGDDNFVGPFCYIAGNVVIGNGNRFEAYSSVGTAAEHSEWWKKETGYVSIGNNNIIREHTTINAGTFRATTIADNCIMLRGSHLSHDSILEDNVTVSCSVLIGGETIVMKGANLGLAAIIHQRQIIGAYCMIGMGAVVTKKLNCVPGNMYAGNPAKFLKQNVVGLHRMRVTSVMLEEEIKRFALVRNKNPHMGCPCHEDL